MHRLWLIFLLNIKADMHNKFLGRFSMNSVEIMEGIPTKQYALFIKPSTQHQDVIRPGIHGNNPRHNHVHRNGIKLLPSNPHHIINGSAMSGHT